MSQTTCDDLTLILMLQTLLWDSAHPVVEDATLATQHLHQAQVELAHHGVTRHHNVDALVQQLVHNLQRQALGGVMRGHNEMWLYQLF